MAQWAYMFKRSLLCLKILLEYSLLQWYESTDTILGSTCALAYMTWIWKVIYLTNTRWWHKKTTYLHWKWRFIRLATMAYHRKITKSWLCNVQMVWEKQFCKMSFSWMYVTFTRLYCAVPVNFLKNIRVRARYGVSFVTPASKWYSASVPVIIYETSYNIGQRYNGTRQYMISALKCWAITSICLRASGYCIR